MRQPFVTHLMLLQKLLVETQRHLRCRVQQMDNDFLTLHLDAIKAQG